MRLLTILLVAALFAACGRHEPRKLAEAYGEAPYLQSRVQGCLEVSGLYIPPRSKALLAMLAADSMARPDSRALDSAVAATSDGRSFEFRLRVSPAPHCRDTVNFHASDVVYGQQRGQEGIDRAIRDFQQGLASKLWIRAGEYRVKPSFYHVESVLGLDNSREIWAVFRPGELERSALEKMEAIELAADNLVPGQGIFILAWPKEVLADGA